MEDGIVLTMRGICKNFPGVRAWQNVDFTLRKGEIHALMGENGAGKSTLIKVLTGVYEKDAGEIRLEGNPVTIRSPQDAQNVGISTVYQEITLCPNLTVAENMYIGRGKGVGVQWKEMEKKYSGNIISVREKVNTSTRIRLTFAPTSLPIETRANIITARSSDGEMPAIRR